MTFSRSRSLDKPGSTIYKKVQIAAQNPLRVTIKGRARTREDGTNGGARVVAFSFFGRLRPARCVTQRLQR